MTNRNDKRLLQLVGDYFGGNFTITSEGPLIAEIIDLVDPILTHNDVFEIIFEEGVDSPEEGVTALQARAKAKYAH